MITRHATKRARQRCGASSETAEAFLAGLWALGRRISAHDLDSFGMCAQPEREYRLAIRQGVAYIVVMGRDGNFLTVMKRRV